MTCFNSRILSRATAKLGRQSFAYDGIGSAGTCYFVVVVEYNYEGPHEKTNNVVSGHVRNKPSCTRTDIWLAKIKALISFAVAMLICVFVIAYAIC